MRKEKRNEKKNLTFSLSKRVLIHYAKQQLHFSVLCHVIFIALQHRLKDLIKMSGNKDLK